MRYIYLLAFLFLLSCANGSKVVVDDAATSAILVKGEKITGVNLEMPKTRILDGDLDDLLEVNIGWAAMVPYGMTKKGGAKVFFEYNGGYWWGESVEGTSECIRIAQEAGLKTMVKPHVWVVGDGWPGDFKLKKERDWKAWEASYRDYILAHAKLADSMSVDLFCIGTEYRNAVVDRKKFWVALIKEVRGIYNGPITYASNWDNYEAVTFWDHLDFIGVDTYFPLSSEKNVSLDKLKEGWADIGSKFSEFSKKYDRRILFTEYGFKSVDYTSAPNYGANEDTLSPNMENQVVAYNAFFETVWQQDWMAGGFFWKWHVVGEKGGAENTRYTPQGKPALDVIREWYGKAKE